MMLRRTRRYHRYHGVRLRAWVDCPRGDGGWYRLAVMRRSEPAAPMSPPRMAKRFRGSVACLALFGCSISTDGMSAGEPLPEQPALGLSYSAIKQFDFAWAASAGAEFYRVELAAGD